MPYRYVSHETIASELATAIKYITFNPDPDLPAKLKLALNNESNPLSREILNCMLQNIELSPAREIPLCQDTGTLVVFAEIGNQCIIEGLPLPEIINETLKKVSAELYLRPSILQDPLFQEKIPAIMLPPLFISLW